MIKREANKRKRANARERKRLSTSSEISDKGAEDKSKLGGVAKLGDEKVDGSSTCSSDDEYKGVVLKSRKTK